MTDQAPLEPSVVERRWWLAALLQFFAVAGSVYVGRPLGFLIMLIFSLLVLAGCYHGGWGALSNVWIVWAILATGFALFLYYFVEAVRLAITQRNYQLQWYNRWWIYLGCFAVWTGISIYNEYYFESHAAVRNFSIPSVSMAPAIQEGDYILADTSTYNDRDPQPGEIAVFKLPSDPGIDFVKRVIGLPGDRITLKEGVVVLNGVNLELNRIEDFEDHFGEKITQNEEHMANGRRYNVLDVTSGSAVDNAGEFVVPAGHYFVLGDHRDNSVDSRFPTVGFVPRENFRGPVTGILWAKDWSRIGNLN